MYLQPRPQPQEKKKQTNFEIWWANLLPASVKAIMPHWSISAVISTGLALLSGSQTVITMMSLFWASTIFTLAFRALRPHIGKQKWIIPAYHGLLFAFVASPVFAQEGAGAACTQGGLFAPIANFAVNIFSVITFTGGVSGGQLSSMICQVIGLLTIGLLLGFLGVLGTVSYQVGYQRQPIATVLDPVFGFLIFAGGSAFVISVMLGTATVN